jgi:hypothetical protein
MGSGIIGPRVLVLALVASQCLHHTLAALSPGNDFRYTLDKRLDGQQGLSGRYGEENILVLTRIPTPTPRSSSP